MLTAFVRAAFAWVLRPLCAQTSDETSSLLPQENLRNQKAAAETRMRRMEEMERNLQESESSLEQQRARIRQACIPDPPSRAHRPSAPRGFRPHWKQQTLAWHSESTMIFERIIESDSL